MLPRDVPPTPIGAMLAGKYAIRRVIGRGGMGAVYEAEHVAIGRRVAIKLIDRSHARNEETAERFRREARAAGRIESAHIVQVSDVGEDPQFGLFMVMEYLEGEDLEACLRKRKSLTVEEAVRFAFQIARGLSKAHAANVVHRDLKPANVFLSRRDAGPTVKIVDFGVSKLLGAGTAGSATDRKQLTRQGITMGTPQYMSPEQVQSGDVDPRTDVWALGCLLYEMIAGRPAFERLSSYEETVLAIVLRSPPRLDEVARGCPMEVADLVHQALNRDLTLRLQSCDEFADRLLLACPWAFGDALPPLSDPRRSSPSLAHGGADESGRISGRISPSRISVPDAGVPKPMGAVTRAAFLALALGLVGMLVFAMVRRPRSANTLADAPNSAELVGSTAGGTTETRLVAPSSNPLSLLPANSAEKAAGVEPLLAPSVKPSVSTRPSTSVGVKPSTSRKPGTAKPGGKPSASPGETPPDEPEPISSTY